LPYAKNLYTNLFLGEHWGLHRSLHRLVYFMVILFDRFHLSEDIFEIVFATNQQKIVAKELIKFIFSKKGEITKTEMSQFATTLHNGEFETELEEEPYKGKRVRLSYNKRQFYDRILTPMKSMGLIDYDLYKKTYKITVKFETDLQRIGEMWTKYVRQMKGIE